MSINLGCGGRGRAYYCRQYLDGKSVGKLWRIVGSIERERNEGEKQQSARNVDSEGGVRVVSGHRGTVVTTRELRDSVPAFLHACVSSSWR